MEISEQLRCLFSGRVEEEGGSYVVEVPKHEVERGNVDPNGTYRVALVPAPSASGGDGDDGVETGRDRTGAGRASTEADDGTADDADSEHEPTADDQTGRTNDDHGYQRQRPPVEEGETRRVEIQDLGDQGDGITRVERGFVVIVPDTEQGERVEVEITDVRENVAFGEVVERVSYYE